MDKKLAIVIPAYKKDFLFHTLESIANQTCKAFNVYIGDDCSPHELGAIVTAFESSLDITYHRFSENLGGKDLVGHWNRCIDMTNNEEWVWLFSDDDMMDKDCVSVFYQEVEKHPQEIDLFHFNIQLIDEQNKIIKSPPAYPRHTPVLSYLTKRLRGQTISYVVEYIFRKETFVANNGFVYMDMAWNADDASWVSFGFNKGIYSVDKPYVYWRSSTQNITPNNTTTEIVLRKMRASIHYGQWVTDFFAQNGQPLSFKLNLLVLNWLIFRLFQHRKKISRKEFVTLLKEINKVVKNPFFVGLICLYQFIKSN